MFDTPILLIIFNRPRHTEMVFNEIRKLQPSILFVAADGPRNNNPEDMEKCTATRETITKNLDWDCELKTLFREENRGCGYGPAEAITWFFEHVDEGIILEDDCLPSSDFFNFCKVMLTTYRDDDRISVISGTNPLINWKKDKLPFIFSRFGSTWGWATWKKAWSNFDHKMEKWGSSEGKEKIRRFLDNDQYYYHFEEEFNTFSLDQRRKDVWDHQWFFSRLYNSTYSIVSTVNLVSNIGFGNDATHTFDEGNRLDKLKLEKISLPLNYHEIKIDKVFDWILFKVIISRKKRNLINKILVKIVLSINTG